MTLTKLSGWKMIARHLGRSERAIQLWEAERGLPVRRIPGAKGWTVYAYVHELEAWMAGGTTASSLAKMPFVEAGAAAGTAPAVPSTTIEPAPTQSDNPAGAALRPQGYGTCKPGLLVMPFDLRSGSIDASNADACTDRLIARFAAMNPALRVLSSTTSRRQRDRATSVDTLSRELGVRYVVEGSMHATRCTRHVDLRIVDAELDQILLTDSFASSRLDDESFFGLVVDGIVEHFSLVLAGALVEPLYPNEIDPECYIHYLEGVRYFTGGRDEALANCRKALDRALLADAGFMPALALGALADLQVASGQTCDAAAALSAARRVADRCRVNPGARMTAAFLDAAIAIEFERDATGADRQLFDALLAMPSSVALRGRLYDRRSFRRCREAMPLPTSAERAHADVPPLQTAVAALDELVSRQPQDLFANVMRAMAGAHRRKHPGSPHV